MEYQKGLEDLQREITELKQIQQAQEQPPQQPQDREPEESTHHNRQFDEEETRNWQRGDGLMREDTASAKYTALSQDTKKQDTPQSTGADPGEAARNSTGATAEQTIDQYSQRIEQLKADRAQLGLFAGKEKKALDEQISRLEQSKAQAQGSLQRECSGAATGDALEQIQQQQATARAQLKELPDLGKLKEQQTAAAQAYKQEKAATMQRPDKDRIQELMESKPQQTAERLTMRERIAAAKAESKLQEKDSGGKQSPTKGMDRGNR